MQIVRSWLEEHRFGTVSTEMFLEHVAQQAGGEAAALLDPWLRETALPTCPVPASA